MAIERTAEDRARFSSDMERIRRNTDTKTQHTPGGCPSEEEMAYEERIADLQRQNAQLLEALEALLAALALPSQRLTTTEENEAAMREAHQLATAAIAAARGES